MIGKKPGFGPDSVEATSVIGENSAFEGTLEVNGNLRVDGKFSGKLKVTETLQVGKTGYVDAEVNTRSAIVAGTIKGNLNASDKISLQSGSRLEGEMVTAKLVIEEGVSFQGSCNTAKGGSAPKADSRTDRSVQDKIEEVTEELAKK